MKSARSPSASTASSSVGEPTFFASAAEFRRWLETNGGSADALLVGFHKVGSDTPSVSWSESVDEALCFGWIDGVRRRIDEVRYSIRFTPRKATSIWSAINIVKIEALRAAGRMTEAGEQAFAVRTEARSKVYSHEREHAAALSQSELRTFRRNASAWRYFESTPPGYRRVVLHWVISAKKPETRAARLGKLIDASAAGGRLR